MFACKQKDCEFENLKIPAFALDIFYLICKIWDEMQEVWTT